MEKKDDVPFGVCMGFVWGVADMDQEFKSCIGDRRVHGRQIREVVSNYIRAHPEHRDLPGVTQV